MFTKSLFFYSKLFIAGLMSSLSWLPLHAQEHLWSWDGVEAWAPPSEVLADKYPPSAIVIPIEAIADESTPSITLRFYSAPNPGSSVHSVNVSGTYDIYRKHPEATEWGDSIGSVTINTEVTTWVDDDVEIGTPYEYGLKVQGTTSFVLGNVIAGIRVDRTLPRGRIVVAVAEDIQSELSADFQTYLDDLTRDGWVVHVIETPRIPDYSRNGTGPVDENELPTAPYANDHILLRTQIQALYTQYPDELKHVVLVGRAPITRSGISTFGPDGHGNRNSVATDVYFADMDGIWTDTGSNDSQFSGNNRSKAIARGEVNIPGDNKFDPTYLYQVTSPNSRLELGFGRIDFSNPNVPAEYESMRNYFRKLHRYKHAAPDFRPRYRAYFRTQFGIILQKFLYAMPGLVGMEQMDMISKNNVSLGGDSEDPEDFDLDGKFLKHYDLSYLFMFRGSNQPEYSEGVKSVFATGMQSYFGYWYDSHGSHYHKMIPRLAEDNWILSYTWSIGIYGYDTSYLYHRLGMGGDIGNMMRTSLSDRYPYSSIPSAYVPARNPVLMNHMGDPTLRIFMFPPPTQLQVLPSVSGSQLSWTAAEAIADQEPLLGYHVYRANLREGPYERITTTPIDQTTYVDNETTSGNWYYQVRAVRLEQTGGGTFYNASLGAWAEVDFETPAAPLAIDTATLPSFVLWNTEVSIPLSAEGGTPLYTWSLSEGSLPEGLSLDTEGSISGVPTSRTGGISNFTLEVTDAQGQQTQSEIELETVPQNHERVFPEDSMYVVLRGDATGALSSDPHLRIGNGNSNYRYESIIRFDISSYDFHQGFEQALLVLHVDGTTPENSPIVLQVALFEEAADLIPVSEFLYSTLPANHQDTAVEVADTLPVRHEKLTVDITSLVRETIHSDPDRILTLRLFSETSIFRTDYLRIPHHRANRLAQPRIELYTTGQNEDGQTISQWRDYHFGQSENTGEAADSEAPAGDGIPNLLKYTLGLDPMKNYQRDSLAPQMQWVDLGADRALGFRLTLHKNREDAQILLQATNDLSGTWEDIELTDPGIITTTIRDHPEPGLNTLIIRDTEENPVQRFLRLRAKQP